MTNDVKAAAERVRQGPLEATLPDFALLANEFLREHPADDDVALTVEWLENFEPGLCPRQFGMRTRLDVKSHDGGKWLACIAQSDFVSETPLEEMDSEDVSHVAIEVKTRGDVRRLCAVLSR